MTPNRETTVALVDPLWVGHHPMYFSQFTASFLRNGANVIGLCPQPEEAMRDLTHTLGRSVAAVISHRVFFHELPPGKRSFMNGRFEGDPLRTFLRWKTAADHLADAESLSGFTADLIYFPYLDSYLRFLPFAFVPKFTVNRAWSGLYLRNHHHAEKPSPAKALRMLAKGDRILRSGLCRGIGVLDERFIPAMEKGCGKPVTPYPDVTQEDLPAEPSALSVGIRSQAAGRTIIGMIGLERRKGLLTMLKAADLARQRDLPYYFVCAGRIFLEEYNEQERQELLEIIRKAAAGEIRNLHIDPGSGRIPDEADYNSLFDTFDIAWAAYEGFQGSSGTLSKAAAFEIPCIATAGECVGLRVERYRLGATIKEGRAEEALAIIPALAAGKKADGQALNPDFAAYRQDHSQARLDRILADLLDKVRPPVSSP